MSCKTNKTDNNPLLLLQLSLQMKLENRGDAYNDSMYKSDYSWRCVCRL